jgi:hypothetical protein
MKLDINRVRVLKTCQTLAPLWHGLKAIGWKMTSTIQMITPF